MLILHMILLRIFSAGRFNPLTQKQLNAVSQHLLQQAGFNHVNYASRSFRIGAVTTAAAASFTTLAN